MEKIIKTTRKYKGKEYTYIYHITRIAEPQIDIPEGWTMIDDVNDVIYTKVPGYKAIVSNTGRLWHYGKSKESFKEANYSSTNKYGYIHGYLTSNDGTEKVSTTIGRIVCYTFGKLSTIKYNGFDVDHIDNDVKNNKIENLRVITHADNIKKRDINGSIKNKPVALYDKTTNNLERLYASSKDAAYFIHDKYGIGVNSARVAICNSLKNNVPYKDYVFKFIKL